jgi:branched-chain amino acid transport system substrate-binding protein
MIKTGTALTFLALCIFLGITTGTLAFAEGIKVGVLLPLTGKLAQYGDVERKSFLMAANEINGTGGIHGEPIRLYIEDTKGKPAVGKAAIDRLIQKDGVCIVGGGISSSVTWAASRLAQKNKVPFLVNTASADKITEKGGDYIFRLNAPISEHHMALASFVKHVARVKTVAILYENTLFGQSQSQEFVERCRGLGLRVVIKESYEVGTTAFEQITKINGRKPDLFYMISSSIGTDPSMIVKQARELNLQAKIFVGGGAGFTLSKFQENAGSASDYVFAATLWTPSVQYPGASDYFNKFVAKYNELTEYHGAQAYSAMYVIADALKRAQSHTPHDVRDALVETDIMTVFGPVKFISYGKKKLQNRIPTFLGQWRNKKFEAVWPKNLCTVKYVYPIPVRDEQNKLYFSTD